MNETIKYALLSGRLVLFLGAGASYGAKNRASIQLPLGDALAVELAKEAGLTYANESLGATYNAAKRILGGRLPDILSKLYEHATPSAAQRTIARYPWARLYTTNIDDSMETALHRGHSQLVKTRGRHDRIQDKDQLFTHVDYIYLNGSITRFEDGLIFSAEEFGKATSENPPWHTQLAADFSDSTFLFIGTELNEPTFYHQIERLKNGENTHLPRGFVLKPEATQIETISYESANLEHIPSTIEDFASWLETELASVPSSIDLASARNPLLINLLAATKTTAGTDFIELMQAVTPISRVGLLKAYAEVDSGTIRPFYRGFKPNWRDILDGVPALLRQFERYFDYLEDSENLLGSGVAMIGPAGSGKSTFLKLAALRLADQGQPVYEIRHDAEDVSKILMELNSAATRATYIFIDRLDWVRDSLKDLWRAKTINNLIIVGAESQRIWTNRVKANIGTFLSREFVLREIEDDDVDPIIEKLRLFGPWTRLQRLKPAARRTQLFRASRRQLLIGLLETTIGFGFEQIIENDFKKVTNRNDQLFLIIVCLCTMNRASASSDFINRALVHLSITESTPWMASRLKGIVEYTDTGIVARHPVYARKILFSVVETKLIIKVISALLDSFSKYEHPVVSNIDRGLSGLFKSLISHRFLADILRSDHLEIKKLYSRYEKIFEKDGLYWLQYGRALRASGDHFGAYEKLKTAVFAYKHDHTLHALAQQEMILANHPSVSTQQADEFLKTSLERLKELDAVLDSDDTYPIVTMAEGHTKVLKRIKGDAVARVQARNYSDDISQRLRRQPNPRLQACYELLFKYATTGIWKESASD